MTERRTAILEALDVMLELTRVQPGFYSKDGLHEPFLLRFTGNGKGAGYLFSVAWLDAATHIATVPRMKGERIIWISESGSFGEIKSKILKHRICFLCAIRR